ncbi:MULTISPECIES: hypothetical protein [unclassified Clostridium]|uniref:hypothetical protein n=1 Tax=unclassified Clostridium TaxID=2614128 RepID=UPI0013F927E1|nr:MULTISPECIES: hypothetical protein [unclassified Clostridium]MBN1050715.1 hypothetical protein [Clostridium botulinum]MBN1054010.1 hypothetical protein [Clostridium botulinum]NFR87711.1 hypothetical protein [Clostridium botulinum]NFR90474.1 hypothetical protein [Clostridium botulinum]NFT98358.1 hypothetical protein [Clostridium botulinum]
MDELLDKLSKYPNGTKLIIELSEGAKIIGEVDTICESDNGLDMEEEGYEEYYACIIKVLSILDNQKQIQNIKIGSLMEISMQNPPLGIWLEDTTAVWQS